MKLLIPNPSMVLLIGPSGCGKSTFARAHFKPTEILSSDTCRGWVSDDENDQSVTKEAFDLLRHIAGIRLSRHKTVVIDATNVQAPARKELLDLAHAHHALACAIIFNLPEEVCVERNKARPDRQFGPHVIRNQMRDMRRSFANLRREGFRYVHFLKSIGEVEAVEIERVPLWTDRRDMAGPFDIIGDVHGCFNELSELMTKLGYQIERLPEPEVVEDRQRFYNVTPPEGRMAFFVGDLVDRGPDSPSVLKLAMSMVGDGTAMCVPGNHDEKLLRKLRGRDVKIAHGLAETLAQLEQEPPEFHDEVRKFLDSLISHFVLDDGKLVIAHAGMREDMQGRASMRVREFALYGETTGETDDFGLPVRFNWAAEYRGQARVVYGHTPVPQPEWLNRTINIDTGCVFGGSLTALRYPEMELISVPAKATYAESVRPFLEPPAVSAQHALDDLLDIDDVIGRRHITTSLRSAITIPEENSAAALEVMSRFATNPKWLVYLPPTMSPTETSMREGYLEYPDEGFAYFRNEGVPTVIVEEKHMGSRAVVVVTRSEEVALKRFGVADEGIGAVFTRTGRRFFDDLTAEQALLGRLATALGASGFWDKLETDWAVLDCELMPWSAKAQELLKRQYALVGASSRHATSFAFEQLKSLSGRPIDEECRVVANGLLETIEQRASMAGDFVEAYRRYCWRISGIEGLKLAPFHVLATEKGSHHDRDHVWHMQTLAEVCREDPELLLATANRLIDVTDPASVAEGCAWWEEMTGRGGEGMVIKPLSFVARGAKGLIQPAVKCRGREYLRIIYGPEYTQPDNLARLRKRGLTKKRSLANREFALGLEALDRFVRREPLRRVHECVFGVLALESEPVDPRL
jgi:protein phosphatase